MQNNYLEERKEMAIKTMQNIYKYDCKCVQNDSKKDAHKDANWLQTGWRDTIHVVVMIL